MSMPIHNGSFWFDSLDAPVTATPAAPLPAKVDVAIIGAGFTGLWTAYYLLLQDPGLDIAIFDANVAGFGASGRNGGWCMGWAMGIEQLLARPKLAERGLVTARAMQNTVDEIGRVSQAENIDCHYAKGGTLTVATTPFHAARMQETVKHRHALGFTQDDYAWLQPDDARQRLAMTPNYGALYTPHCAAIHPARLVRGLSAMLRSRGVAIHELTPVLSYEKGRLQTGRGSVNADVILRATEGYTDSIAGHKRQLLPLYSMMVATEPLSDETWSQIGLARRETFGDARRVVIYGQRTLDNRIAFGGRAGYYFGSRRIPVVPPEDRHFAKVEQTLKQLFPILESTRITHRWGGLMGVPRHWRPFVTFDRRSGLGAAGGYTGEGVAATNLAARILADLVMDRDTANTHLPWVEDVPRRWEPEPFRWLGVSAIERFGDRADAAELDSGRPSKLWGWLFDRFVG